MIPHHETAVELAQSAQSQGQHAQTKPLAAAITTAQTRPNRGSVPCSWYTCVMPTGKPRIQVTVDDELARALAGIDPKPASHSALIRDLALRGAEAIRADRDRAAEALDVLLEIADGTRDYDLAAASAAAAGRGERLP